MKDNIIHKAIKMFLKIGFKSVTMEDIATEMGISKKTIYKYFDNKEMLIEEGTKVIHIKLHQKIASIIDENHNAIEENFVIKKMFAEMFKIAETSPLFQLKKYYFKIYNSLISREINKCEALFKQNILKGISQGFYRKNLNIESYVKFYYTLIFNINENTVSEKEVQNQEILVLEYHIRAMATDKGIVELEKQLLNYNI